MKWIITAVVASTIAATPALAQWSPRAHGWNPNEFWRGAPENPYDRIQFLQDRVNRGVADGSLDRREAWRANQELNGVRQWMRRMHWRNGGQLSPDQRARVQARLDAISRQIRWARHNG